MQNTSATWKSLWSSGNAWLDTVAVINGVEYSEISNPIINRALMQNELSIGNVVSATCQFSVRTSNVIPRSAEVIIKTRLTDGTTTSEWLNQGTFYIAKRSKDPVTGVINLECYDALLKGNANVPSVFPWNDNNRNIMVSNSGNWIYFSSAYPRSMKELLYDLLLSLGLTLDSRTVIKTGAAYRIESIEPETTVNDILKAIAFANGGNWIVTKDNKLRLVPITSAANAESATSDVVDVLGITNSMGISGSNTITGIRCSVDDETFITGDDSGIVIDAEVTVPVALDLAQWMIGLTYQPYDLQGCIYDPAAELGDYVRGGANDEVRSVLYSENVTLGQTYNGGISAPEMGDMEDEYPYIGVTKKALQVAKAYTRDVVNTFDRSLDQDAVFNRLTDNGNVQGLYMLEDQLYINANYIKSGIVKAQYLDGENLHVKAANVEGTLTIGQLPSDVATEGEVTVITENTIKTTNVVAQNLKVNAANITGTLVIGQLPDTVAETSDIPTKVSQLNNDKGYQDATQVTTITKDTISTTNVTAQNLKVNAANISGTLTIGQLPGTVAEMSDIPTKVSQLNNDSGYQDSTQVTQITNNTISTTNVTAQNLKVKAANITGTLTIGQLPSTVAETSDIPTKVSELTNDSGFQNSSQVTTITENTVKTTDVTAQNLKVNAANVSGTLTVGGQNNTNGQIIIKNASGTTIGTLNNSGASMQGSFTAQSGSRKMVMEAASIAAYSGGAYTGGIEWGDRGFGLYTSSELTVSAKRTTAAGEIIGGAWIDLSNSGYIHMTGRIFTRPTWDDVNEYLTNNSEFQFVKDIYNGLPVFGTIDVKNGLIVNVT